MRNRLRAEFRVFASPTCWVHFRSSHLEELNREWTGLHKEYDKAQSSIVGEVLEIAGVRSDSTQILLHIIIFRVLGLNLHLYSIVRLEYIVIYIFSHRKNRSIMYYSAIIINWAELFIN